MKNNNNFSGKKFIIQLGDVDLRLDKFLISKGLNFALINKLIRKKLIRVNQEKTQISYNLQEKDLIEILAGIDFSLKAPKPTKFVSSNIIQEIKGSIIFQDKNIIILNKKAGLAVQGGSGINLSVDDMLPYLKFENIEKPKLVHRLDKDTSGILLIARNRASSTLLTSYFKNRQIKKTYYALVKGCVKNKKDKIDIPLIKKYQGKNEKVYRDNIMGKNAVTYYELLKYYPDRDVSILKVNPITGRTHQIRVHLKEIGHPIIGDFKYGSSNTDFGTLKLHHRLYLHAMGIEIEDFFGKKLSISTHNNVTLQDYLGVFGGLI